MPRDISTGFRSAAEASSSEDVYLTFITMSHPRLNKKIRVVDDVVNYQYGGEIFQGFPFEITLPTDSEENPNAKITIQNVDREIGETIVELTEAPILKIEVLLLSQFGSLDTGIDARPEIGTAVPDYVADRLKLTKVSVDAMSVSANITSYDYAGEPWPFYRATKNRLPGLFR